MVIASEECNGYYPERATGESKGSGRIENLDA